MSRPSHFVYVCIGPDCGDQRGANALVDKLRMAIDGEGLPVELLESACFGQCRSGPNVVERTVDEKDDLMMVRLMPLFGRGVVMHHRVTAADIDVLVARLRMNPLRR